MKKIMIILLLLISLSACSKTEDKIYNPPQNLSYDSKTEVLSWDPIEGVSLYVLVINDQETRQASVTYDMSLLPTGDYTVKVKAIYQDKESRYAYPLVVTIIRESSFTIKLGDMLSFDEVFGADTYKLSIYNILNELLFEGVLSENQYDYKELLGIARFELSAYLKEQLVAKEVFSIDFKGSTHTKDTDTLTVSIQQAVDKLYIDDLLIDPSSYTKTHTEITMSSEILDGLEEGRHIIKLEGKGDFYTFLDVTSYKKPLMTTSGVVTYDQKDLTFEFELYGGTFDGISSNPGLEAKDFTFEGELLTIHKTFIEDVIKANPDRKTIIFSYLVTNGPYTVVGFITVNLK